MLRYYLPGLDVSTISDEEFVQRIRALKTIRQMEKAESVETAINKIF